MKKKHLLTALFTVFVAVAQAQITFGVDYFSIGEMQTAKEFFEKQVAQNPAECNYYLGEIAYAEGKADIAKDYYAKGVSANPLFMLNYIGQGKLILKSNQKEAEAIFATALKKNKKDDALNVAIARAYFENDMKDILPLKMAVASKVCKKSPLFYVLEGDILQAEKKLGDAAGKYEQAIYFDPNFTVASIKCAQVYESLNPTLSVELLKKVIANHPDYTVVYRNLGRTYYQSGHYADAIDAFKTYFALGRYSIDDITRFAYAYYFTDQFPQSIELQNEGIKREPNNFVFNRLRMYNASKTKDTTGIAIADHFFSLKSENGTFITSDYSSYATILSDAGQYDMALDQFNKVLATENPKPELYKDMAAVYTKKGDNIKAVASLEKFVELTGIDVVEVVDLYTLGRAYYNAGKSMINDSSAVVKEKGFAYLVKADTTFGAVCQKAPDSYTGYLWRGNTNLLLDPKTEKGLAKPYYEAAIAAIMKKGTETNGNKRDLIICYRYLGVYYSLRAEASGVAEDKANSIKYLNLLLEQDPTNAMALQVLESYKEVKK